MSAPPAPSTRPSILVVDDDDVLRSRLAKAFRERGFEVYSAAGYEEAVALARSESPELALVDLKMPGKSGLELVRTLKEVDPATNVVVLTGYGSIATAVDAVRLGATHYISKPADVDDILTAFARQDADLGGSVARDFTAPSLARAEWEHINRVLSDCDGNISEAARRLKVHRRSLQRKLQKFPPKD
jgi:two-component system response regulator RegA